MSREREGLVNAFLSLDGVGVVGRRWLLAVGTLIARAECELADGERSHQVAIGESPDRGLEGIVLTDQRIGVISRQDVRWFSRAGVWEVSSVSLHPVSGQVLRVYGDSWELSWTQVRPACVGEQMRVSLTEEHCAAG